MVAIKIPRLWILKNQTFLKIFIYLIIVDVRTSLRIPRLIPHDPRVTSRVNLLVPPKGT